MAPLGSPRGAQRPGEASQTISEKPIFGTLAGTGLPGPSCGLQRPLGPHRLASRGLRRPTKASGGFWGLPRSLWGLSGGPQKPMEACLGWPGPFQRPPGTTSWISRTNNWTPGTKVGHQGPQVGPWGPNFGPGDQKSVQGTKSRTSGQARAGPGGKLASPAAR